MSTNGKVSENQFQLYPIQLKKKRKYGGTVKYPQRLANPHVLYLPVCPPMYIMSYILTNGELRILSCFGGGGQETRLFSYLVSFK